MTGYCVVMVTAEHLNQAEDIAEVIVKEKLAACVNIVDSVRSVFVWKGELNQAGEVMLVIKTKTALFDQLKQRIKEVHTYEMCQKLLRYPS